MIHVAKEEIRQARRPRFAGRNESLLFLIETQARFNGQSIAGRFLEPELTGIR